MYFFKTIMVNKASFAALLVFSCFCAMFYVGLGCTGISFLKSEYDYVSNRNLHDFSVVSPFGFSDDDVEKIKNIDGIDEAEGRYLSYQFFDYDGRRFVIKIMQVTEQMDLLTVTEGVLPKSPDEIAVEGNWAKDKGLKLGDRISLSSISGEPDLSIKDYVITAFTETPEYFQTNSFTYETTGKRNLPLSAAMFVRKEAFCVEETGFSEIILRSNILRSYEDGSDEYKDAAEVLKESVSFEIMKIAKDRRELVEKLMQLKGIEIKQESEVPDMALFTRNSLTSIIFLGSVKEMMDDMRMNLSFPFIIICLLIAISTILRMTREEEKLIGIRLALGATKADVAWNYVAFCIASTLIGTLLGGSLGALLIEKIFMKIMCGIWFFEKHIIAINMPETIELALSSSLLMTVTSGVSCVFVFRKDIISMINKSKVSRMKQSFWEKKVFWNRCSLLTRSILKNIHTDRLRVFVSIIGIAGCTALCTSSIVAIDSVKSALQMQYEKKQEYEMIVYFDSENAQAKKNIQDILTENKIVCSPAYIGISYIDAPDGKIVPVSVLVSEREFDGLLHFYNEDGETIPDSDGRLLSIGYASFYNIDKDDTVHIKNKDGKEMNIPIDDAFLHYLVNQELAFDKADYEALTGTVCYDNIFLVRKTNLSEEELNLLLHDTDGFYYVFNHKNAMSKSFSVYETFAMTACILKLILSIGLAFFMLLSIFSQFVIEKKNELIVLMINGYSVRYVYRYLYIDTIILAIIGLFAGGVIGNIIGCLDISSLSSAFTYFPNGVDLFAVFAGMGIAAVFTAIMCAVALTGIGKLEISDINKV